MKKIKTKITEKDMNRFSELVVDMDADDFYLVFTPYSYYNLSLEGAIDTYYLSEADTPAFGYDTPFKENLRDLYNSILVYKDEILDIVCERWYDLVNEDIDDMNSGLEEGDEGYVNWEDYNFLGIEWYNVVIYFIRKDLEYNSYIDYRATNKRSLDITIEYTEKMMRKIKLEKIQRRVRREELYLV